MNRTALITGASGVIGAATARLFARHGYNIAAHYNTGKARAEALLKECLALGADTDIFKADVGDRAAVEKMFSEIKKRFGAVGVLINNAGIARQQLFLDTTERDFNEMLRVNVTGMFNCCKCALRDIIDMGGGSIVNISSVWGIAGASCEVAYSTSKAAVIGLTKALAKEMGPSGIRVNCVAPGVIDTEMNAGLSAEDIDALAMQTPLGRLGRPEEVARAILFLASDAGDFITGQVLSPNGGFLI
ncbi:MAG TPA: 3-oxoacyl-ACP reductase [Ruminococcaceae bacterium]|nr:3-oxoacyl-ACP reductase [Oscillospiraceae bacterium]